jgi:hypothetical protein
LKPKKTRKERTGRHEGWFNKKYLLVVVAVAGKKPSL